MLREEAITRKITDTVYANTIGWVPTIKFTKHSRGVMAEVSDKEGHRLFAVIANFGEPFTVSWHADMPKEFIQSAEAVTEALC